MAPLSYKAGLWLSIAATLLHVIGIFVTAFRLYYRRCTQRLWWDDYTAGVALFADFIYIPIMWFSYGPTNSLLYSKPFFAAKFWMITVLFTMIIWLSRISIVLAIARIFQPGELTRRFSIVAAYIFGLFMLSVILQFAIECPKNMIPIGRSPARICNINQLFGFRLSILIMEVISDVFLVVTPLYKLWKVRLPSEQRRLILSGFATSVLTTITTIVCAVFQFATNGDQSIPGKITFFEAAVALVNCNFLVIVTYIHTRRRRGEELHRTVLPETCSNISDREPVSHSNHVPNSSALTTLSLTQMTVSYDYVESESTSRDGPSSSGNSIPPSKQNSADLS